MVWRRQERLCNRRCKHNYITTKNLTISALHVLWTAFLHCSPPCSRDNPPGCRGLKNDAAIKPSRAFSSAITAILTEFREIQSFRK